MGIISKIFGKHSEKGKEVGIENFQRLKNSYDIFRDILEINNKALAIIGDLEDKASGEYIFDRKYTEKTVDVLFPLMTKFCDNFSLLSGTDKTHFNSLLTGIIDRVHDILGYKVIVTDRLVISLNEIKSSSAGFTGGKNANLGELNTINGISIPEGFAVTTLSFTEFINLNGLGEKIASRLQFVDIKDYNELIRLSDDIREIIIGAAVPEKISEAILSSYDSLCNEAGKNIRVSVRSSAIGEDSRYSFAGQYKTVLNVGREGILDAYRQVIASKFNPKAVYYFLSHGLNEADLLMSAGCIRQIDSAKSGVVYTQNPSGGSEDILIINSILGQGKLLVDGTESPEIVSFSKRENKIIDRVPSGQNSILVLDDSEGLILKDLNEDEKKSEVLTAEEISLLTKACILIEQRFNCPQDIEWAFDRGGRLYILQARQLKVFPKSSVKMPDTSKYEILSEGGISACPGAGSGIVRHIGNLNEISGIPAQSVIVADNPMPGLIAAIRDSSAFICKTASLASHLVTIAREYGIPTIVGFTDTSILRNGEIVTVDAVKAVIYKGEIPELADALKPDRVLIEEIETLQALKRINEYIVPLNLTDLKNNFNIDSCKTIHDILRFIHQKSIESMFETARSLSLISSNRMKLKSEIPIKLDIIYLDKIPENRKAVDENKIESLPLDSFWKGILLEGWTMPPAMEDMKGLLSVMATDLSNQKTSKLAEKSFAVAAGDFMILSLRMGYHYSTIESYVSSEPSKNYIKMKYMEGGASPERRNRRVRIISEILQTYGFLISIKGDFLDVSISYETMEITLAKLFMLGRLAMLTKQLDMALTDDDKADYHKNNIMEKLRLKN